MNGSKSGQPNSLKKIYQSQRMSVKSAIREELEDRGQSYQRFSYWLNKVDDSGLMEIPFILKEIVCKNISAAELLFKLPSLPTETVE